MDGRKLTVGQKLGFGIFDLGGNMLFTLMGFWCLHYLTDVAGLGASLAGIAVMIGKGWDAVTDPVMGFISDRTISPLGRRRPYLLAGALPVMLALWLFFTAPGISNQIMLMLWAAGTLMLVNTASTIISVPYSSLTPELTGDYHERTSLNGYRFGCAVFGTLIGGALVGPLAGAFGGGGRGWSMMGLSLGAVIMTVTLLTFFGTREKLHTRDERPTGRFFPTYRAVFTNKPYVILFVGYALHMAAITFLQGILAYYMDYLYPFTLELPGLDHTTIAMLVLLLTAMVCIPVSVGVSKKIGKKKTYQICFVIIGSACMLVASIGHLLPPPLFLLLLAYAGAGVGFSYVAPFAMVPDTVEFDAVKTGERKEGAYYGMWTLVSKTGAALSMLLTGFILKWGGYRANHVQDPRALGAIRLIIGPLPAFFFLIALLVIRSYPLDEGTYKKLTGQR
ncbi:MAG: MFS transporter [Spirochaetaceae bacterium]|jgi:GPH family glycoside/pentoside/hexuronide:cation symporter|nr:MFS transporter [Spirochaetaceae bacterium]